jgi:Fe(3+) dicitrate transport protein
MVLAYDQTLECGTSPNRSEKITLMEDGVLISPAPYSAPAAYYFPTVSRMQSFEILKGGSQIQYGPYTTGGAINMVSTQIPRRFQAVLLPA